MKLHEQQTKYDQISGSLGQEGFSNIPGVLAHLFLQVFQKGFHSGSTVKHSYFAAVFQYRLSRHNPITVRFSYFAKYSKPQKDTPLFYALLCRETFIKKRAFDHLLRAIFQEAQARRLIEDQAEVSIDATGLESHHVSRHFIRRQGRQGHTKRYRRWTKLTILCHHDTHLIAGVEVGPGPSNDVVYFVPVVTQAVKHLAIDRLLADAGYDAEWHHQWCREQLGMRSTVIPINPRRGNPQATTGRYRRQMYNRFPNRLYRQRWHVECVFSRLKRLLGSALTARGEKSRSRECYYRVLTHNLMILRWAA